MAKVQNSFQFNKRFTLMVEMVLFFLILVFPGCSQQSPWQEQYDLGVRYLSDGNYEEAIIAFTAAIEIEPKLAEAYIGRGQAYIGLQDEEGNLELALADYMAVIEFDAENAEAYLGAADVYIRMGDYDKALEILQQGTENIDDQRITNKINELEQGIRVDSDGNYWKTAYDYFTSGDGYKLAAIYDVLLTPQGENVYSTCKYLDSDPYGGIQDVVGRSHYVKNIQDAETGKWRKNYYYDDGTLYQYYDIVLDDLGREVSRITYWSANDGDELYEGTVEYTDIVYDDTGKIISEKQIEKDNSSYKRICYDKYYYDELGYLTRIEQYEDGDCLWFYEEYK